MTRRSLAALLAVFAIAACSAQAGASTASPSAAAGGSVPIGHAASSAGDHLVGANGHALYIRTSDSANTSTCSGDCATNWPPVTVSASQSPVAGSGVTAQLGTMTRSDGTVQVTVNGLPLYAYAADATATDIAGQGVGGVWFLAGADGKALGAPAQQPTSQPSGSGGGYY